MNGDEKAAGDSRTPKPSETVRPADHALVLECGCPLPLSYPQRSLVLPLAGAALILLTSAATSLLFKFQLAVVRDNFDAIAGFEIANEELGRQRVQQ